MCCNTPCIIFKFCSKCSFGREGPQLGVFYPSWRKRQPYGSAMGLQAAPLRSPFKVVADAFKKRENARIAASVFKSLSLLNSKRFTTWSSIPRRAVLRA